MKNKKSLKTVGLWVFLIVVFIVIFQTVSQGDKGRELTLSQFVQEALPEPGGTGEAPTSGIAEVRVVGDRLIEYGVRPPGQKVGEAGRTSSDEGGSSDGSGSRSLQWYHTRGDLQMPLGGREDRTVLGELAQRGVRVDFQDKPEGYAAKGEEKPFSVFLAEVRELQAPTNVTKVTIRGKEITGELANGESFVTTGSLGSYRQELIDRGVKVVEKDDGEGSVWLSVLGTWLPMIFIFLIFFLFMRQLQAGGGKAMSFGKSRHRMLNESTKKVTFDQVAGIDEPKDELQEIIEFLKDPKKFTRLGGRIPKGVLLMGPPGTGKTLLAKAVAGEAGVPFFSISGSDFVEMFVGVGASRVRDLFEQGKKNAPCIIFIDELDAVGRHRGAGLGGGHDEREQTLNQLLVEMDGFESNEGVILMSASNRPDVLDPALLRPGRFDRRVVVNRPDIKGRTEILEVHAKNARVAPDVELDVVARSTPGFAGADLENLVNEAALLAARRSHRAITMDDFEAAKDKVLMGSERRSAVLSDEQKWVTAVHEAGHTIVARKVPGNDPVHKVTIIPRGMSLGSTWTLPEEDQYNLTKDQVLARIAMAMGGRVAEDAVNERITTGAGNDIEHATKMARKMVCEWGMSQIGPVSMSNENGSVFIGREMQRGSEFAESTQAEADREIRRILEECYEQAEQVIHTHRDALQRLAEALVEFESLDGSEVDALLEGTTAEELRRRREDKARRAIQAQDEQDAAEAAETGQDPSRDQDGGLAPNVPEPVGSMRSRLEDDDRES